MLDNSPKLAIVREFLRNNYSYIGSSEAKYQTAYNSVRDSLYYYRNKRDYIPSKDSVDDQLIQAVDNCRERRVYYSVFDVYTKKHSKKKGIVYASNEGLGLLREYSGFIVVDGIHNTNKSRFTLLNVYI